MLEKIKTWKNRIKNKALQITRWKSLMDTLKSWAGMITAVLILLGISGYGTVTAKQSLLQHGIAEEVFRFHVLANSDSEEDQYVKYQVRNAILKWINQKTEQEKMSNYKLANCDGINGEGELSKEIVDSGENKENMMGFVQMYLGELETVANQILEEEGMNYRGSAEIVRCYFPDRTYGKYTFPAGWYDALRIKLGEAKGQNWWCMLYPELCFGDCIRAVVEEEQKKELEEVLTVEEYESLLKKPWRWKLAFRWF